MQNLATMFKDGLALPFRADHALKLAPDSGIAPPAAGYAVFLAKTVSGSFPTFAVKIAGGTYSRFVTKG